MPEEQDSAQPLPEDGAPFVGASPDEMFARGMQSVRMSGGAGDWQPPTTEEAARLFSGYEVLKLIGRGGMGAVYQARQVELDRLVALKLLPLEISVDPAFAERFRREARAMAKLHHPNIVTVFDFGTTGEGHLFFVMEYVEGANLADVIHKVGLDDDQALSVAEQVCTALAYAHGKGIVHRDIKPANVMIDTESHVKVADFGLARLTDPSAEQMGTTVTGTIMGTPDYMAPEQTQGMNVDHRADIYSLGVMLYEMLCRQVPKGIFQPPSARIGCDARIDQIVIKAMQQAPEHRYQSTQEMRADVTAARTPQSIVPSAPPQVVHPHPVAQPALPALPKAVLVKALPARARKQFRLLLYAGLAVAVVAVIADAVFFQKQKVSPTPLPAPLPDSTANPLAATKEQPFVNSLGMKFVPVAGTQVLFSVWETRVQDYEVFAKETKREWPGPSFAQGPTHPAVMVNWKDAVAFCAWLSKKEGRKYRLPTDAEWSVAVGLGVESGSTPQGKSGKIRGYPWGNVWPPPKGAGNYIPDLKADDFEKTSPVGSFAANVFGLYDLSGNVVEQCEDWFSTKEDNRVVRGGSWSWGEEAMLRSSHRTQLDPLMRYDGNGFRCVLDPLSPPTALPTPAATPRAQPAAPAPPPPPKATPQPVPVVPPLVPSRTAAAATKDQPFVNSLGMKFVPVAGTQVLFSVWETRVQDYEVFAKETKRDWPKPPFPQEPTHPAVMVSWEDTVAFCEWLSKKEGRKYRLPTDAEWSVAVGLGVEKGSTPEGKANKITGFPWGNVWPPPKGSGNYGPNLKVDDFEKTSPVGSFAGNTFGIFDLGGNVWEWCEDWSGQAGKTRVLRGSSWVSKGDSLMASSSRKGEPPEWRYENLGFRCVLMVGGG